MKIRDYIKEEAALIDKALDRYLPKETLFPEKLHQAMRYSSLAGGKRIRPILTLLAAEIVGGQKEKVLAAAAAIELIHTYSLIHDDLPCMDDDDLRRGKPSNHKVFGEGMAVLAGDALLTYAFGIMTDIKGVPAERVLLAISELAQASGNGGMIGGQVGDILAEGRKINSEELEYIHTHKTGALLRASVRVGAILAGANEEELKALTQYAQEIGLGFQIVDDILDIEGDTEKLGKAVGSDLGLDKATFPAIYGLEESKRMARETFNRAKEAVEIFGEAGEILVDLAEYIKDREA